MFSWLELAILLLKIADAVLGKMNQDKWMKAGADAEIAKISAAILRKTQAGKALMEKVDAMSEAEVDAGLRDLEPRDAKDVR